MAASQQKMQAYITYVINITHTHTHTHTHTNTNTQLDKRVSDIETIGSHQQREASFSEGTVNDAFDARKKEREEEEEEEKKK